MSCIDWKNFNFSSHWVWFKVFLSNLLLNYLLCYWPTIHILISKISPKFQVLSSHFCDVVELLDEHWIKIVWREICNSNLCLTTHIEVKNLIISCLALIFNLYNLRITILDAKNGFDVVEDDKSYTNLWLTWSGWEELQWIWQHHSGFESHRVLKLSATAILCGTESISGLTQVCLHCWALHFFLLKQWRVKFCQQ